MKNRLGIFAIAATAITTATTAQAHNSTEFGGGFLHPVSGIDHLVALIATAPAGVLIAGAVALTVAAIGTVRVVRRSRQS
jgi:hydrogenase/urease accessory protein HupE